MAFSVSALGIHEDRLPAGWSTGRLDTLAILNPEQINDHYPHEEIAYLDIANVGPGRVGEPVRLRLAEAPSRAKRIAKSGDSILSTVRPGNRAYAFLREPPTNLVVSTGFVVLRARPSIAAPRFVYYLVTSDPLTEYLAAIAEEKTAYPSVNPSDIAECTVPIPPLPEQRAIAHILGTLDDKIELNRRMNETLEQIAQAIFKSWFVDFDPVRAKAAGRQPIGMDAATAALFPDSFEDSALGKIPRGWEVTRLAAVAGMNERSVGREYAHGAIEYVDISSVTRGVLEATTRYELPDAPSRAKRLVAHGDTIWSCVRPNRRSYLLINHPPDNLVVSTGFAVLTPRAVSPSYLYSWVTTDRFVDYLSYSADGSAYPAVRPDRFSAAEILVPPRPVLDAFEGTVGPMHDRIAHNDRESRTLAAIRDALLPKLMSGEIRVTDAEKIAEEQV